MDGTVLSGIEPIPEARPGLAGRRASHEAIADVRARAHLPAVEHDPLNADSAQEARRLLERLQQAIETSRQELDRTADVLRQAQDGSFSDEALAELAERLGVAGERVEEEAHRLRALLLQVGVTIQPEEG